MKLRPDQVKNSKLSSKERSLLISQTAFDMLKFENRFPPVGPDVFPFQSTVSMLLGRLPRYSILDFIREGLLAHFSFPFWLHIMIGQLIVCSKKRAKADWLMTCAKADWLRTNVMIFSCYLIG